MHAKVQGTGEDRVKRTIDGRRGYTKRHIIPRKHVWDGGSTPAPMFPARVLGQCRRPKLFSVPREQHPFDNLGQHSDLSFPSRSPETFFAEGSTNFSLFTTNNSTRITTGSTSHPSPPSHTLYQRQCAHSVFETSPCRLNRYDFVARS